MQKLTSRHPEIIGLPFFFEGLAPLKQEETGVSYICCRMSSAQTARSEGERAVGGSIANGTASIIHPSVSSRASDNQATEPSSEDHLLSSLVELGRTRYTCCRGHFSTGLLKSFGSAGGHGKASCKNCDHVPCSSCTIDPGSRRVEKLYSDQTQLEGNTEDEMYLYVCSCGIPNVAKIRWGSWWKRFRRSDTTFVSFAGKKCKACSKAYLPGSLKLKVRKAPTSRHSPNLTIKTRRSVEEIPEDLEDDEDDDDEDELEDGTPPTAQFFPQGFSDLPTPFLISVNPMAFATELWHPAPPNSPTQSVVSENADVESCGFSGESLSVLGEESFITSSPSSPVYDDEVTQQTGFSNLDDVPPFYLWIQQQPYNSDASPSPENNESALDEYIQKYIELLNTSNIHNRYPSDPDVSSLSLGSPLLPVPEDPLKGSDGLIVLAEPELSPLPPPPDFSTSPLLLNSDVGSVNPNGY